VCENFIIYFDLELNIFFQIKNIFKIGNQNNWYWGFYLCRGITNIFLERDKQYLNIGDGNSEILNLVFIFNVFHGFNILYQFGD